MNTYYLTTKATFDSHIDWFHPQLGAHYIDLPNGQILVSASFPADHSSIEIWEAKPGVQILPHPVFEGTQPLNQTQVSALTAAPVVAGAVKPLTQITSSTSSVVPSVLPGITTASTVIGLAKAAAQISPLMKLRSF